MNRPLPALLGKLLPLSLFCCLCLFPILSPILAQESLEAFLASPIPPSPIPEQTAQTTLQKGRSWATRVPARREEILAYLIPFQRVAEPEAVSQPAAVPQPSPSPQPSPAAPKPIPQPKAFLIFKSPEGTVECFKASKLSAQGEVLIAESPEGRKAIWQKNRLATQLPWYSSQELESGVLDLEKLSLRYKALESTFPALKKELQAEQQLLEAASRKLSALKTAEPPQAADQPPQVIVLSQPSARDRAYSRQQLARILLEAEAARRQQPGQASRIQAAMEPFQAHFYALLAKEHPPANPTKPAEAGQPTPVPPKAATKAARAAHDTPTLNQKSQPERKTPSFIPPHPIELQAQILSPNQFQSLLIALALPALALLAWGIFLLFDAPSLPTLLFALLLCATPAFLAIYADRQLSSSHSPPPSFTPTKLAGENQFLHLLSQAAADDCLSSTPERRTTIRESDINTFIARQVKFTPIPLLPSPASGSTPPDSNLPAPAAPPAGIFRTDLAFEFHPDQVILWERSRFKTRHFITRYSFQIQGVGSQARVAGCEVSIGNLPLPGFLGAKLAGNLGAELGKMLQGQPVFENHRLTRLTDGEMDFTRIFRRPFSASDLNPPKAVRPSLSTMQLPAGMKVENMPTPSPTPRIEAMEPGF